VQAGQAGADLKPEGWACDVPNDGTTHRRLRWRELLLDNRKAAAQKDPETAADAFADLVR
jgi:hypothetical protein